ncbi:MAG TPA: thioredoxin domain-containing protein [Candidatus Polarisedimenticolia bacterium]|nr:thioredoxin domain-containing protein [Candidatus Polarisedimenticolia bacterium]
MSSPRPAITGLLLMTALLMIPAGSALRAADEVVTDPAQIKDVDFAGLSEAQKKIALKVMNEHPCNCGCEMTIARCRLRDQSCRRSLIFARTIIDALREGKSEAEVVRVLKAKSDTFVEAKLPDDAGVVYNIDTELNPVRGPKNAPVTIVEFSDFQCPFCAGTQAALDQVLKAFPREVRLVYKQYPLNIHQYARQAALASLAAHAQGKFWLLHDKMFQNFAAINEENIRKWAKEIGLDMTAFDKAMQTSQYEPIIQKDMADGAAAKVLGTPTLFVNGKRLHDRSFEGFKKMIQEALAEIKEGGPSAKAHGATGAPAPPSH